MLSQPVSATGRLTHCEPANFFVRLSVAKRLVNPPSGCGQVSQSLASGAVMKTPLGSAALSAQVFESSETKLSTIDPAAPVTETWLSVEDCPMLASVFGCE